MFTVAQLQRITLNPDPVAYNLKVDRDTLVPEMRKKGVVTRRRICAFLANVSHETDGLKTLEEYGDEAYFRSFLGGQWKYHGRGYLMNTWEDAYRLLSKELGVDLIDDLNVRGDEMDPDKLEKPQLAAKAAVWFWEKNKLNWWVDNGSFWNVCGIINTGGPNPQHINGWADRLAAYNRALAVIKEA